ncbi:MAG: hypothetical protein ACRBFS_04115 [Aureispira sp.]
MKRFLETYNKPLTIVLFIMVVITTLVMMNFDLPLRNENCKDGIVSFELAKDLETTVTILNSWDTNAKNNASLSVGFDFLFLLVYSSFIALLIFKINNRLWENHAFHKVGRALIVLIFSAAFFDMIENVALIKLLLGDLEQMWCSIAYFFAIGKFAIVLICIVYILLNWVLLWFEKEKT